MKKTGLGKDPLEWIKPTVEKKIPEKELPTKRSKEIIEKQIGPKYQTFDIRLTVLLKNTHLEFLDKLVREIHKNRTKEFKRERITKNTLIRCFIEAFSKTEINIKNIPDEETLFSRILEKIK
ncbi:MAG TPA: hypothetical protein PLW95_04970 [bacterium]|nr:hypothetical protein [bacterium]